MTERVPPAGAGSERRPAAALAVDGLAVAAAGRPVLRDVCFRLEPGSCLGLVGETGAGKTMACRAITGRLTRIGVTVTGGSVRYGGTDLLAQSPAQWRALYGRRIGLVPQNSLGSLDPVMKVGRQVRETLRELDPGAPHDARAAELLEMVHLPRPRQVLGAYPHELSGGMRQRLMIALALAGRPDLLVADEPTSALDMTVQHGIVDLLAELRAATGMSVIFVTHDLSVVESIAEQIAVMYAGTVVESGPAPVILTAPRHPYTRALLAARPSRGQRGARLAAIPGQPRPLAPGLAGCQFAERCPLASDQCRAEVPPLAEQGPGHRSACWHAAEVPAADRLDAAGSGLDAAADRPAAGRDGPDTLAAGPDAAGAGP
jgi:oligopeptide/dipeptide ABC transporter ATP-binding protein